MMNSLHEDLWTMILARLPLKSITSSKLVCREWKSIAESAFLRELFLGHHENSHTSWSVMFRCLDKEVMAHYGCEVWGLSRSLGSYMSSFLKEKFNIQKEDNRFSVVVSYTDVGLILVKSEYPTTYYVANPITRQSVEIPPPPSALYFRPSGLVTRIQNGIVLGYKVVLMKTRHYVNPSLRELLVYSSETGSWSFETLQFPFPLRRVVPCDPVSLNGKLYWQGFKSFGEEEKVVVSHDFYAESDQDRVIFYPDSGKNPILTRSFTFSQGFVMYMNADKNDDANLRVWRLSKSEEWDLLYEISLPCVKTRLDYFPLATNPFDANTVYLQSYMHSCSASVYTNLHKAKFGLHNNLDPSSDGRFFNLAQVSYFCTSFHGYYSPFVLPRWLHRIPS